MKYHSELAIWDNMEWNEHQLNLRGKTEEEDTLGKVCKNLKWISLWLGFLDAMLFRSYFRHLNIYV